MSQYGMQMPAGQAQRGPSMNVYTGLLFLAVAALLAASIFVWMQGALIAPDGQPFNVHGYNESTKSYDLTKFK